MSAEPVWNEIDSSNVKAIAYVEDSRTLMVEFAHGGFYTYDGVERDHYVDLVHAESVGRYLNQVIKALYPYRKFSSRDELVAAAA